MEITNTIIKVFPNAPIDALEKTFQHFNITTRQQQAAFVAQVGHESAGFTRTVENLNYSALGLKNTWPNRFKNKATGEPNEKANMIARNPQAIANEVYNGRMGNVPGSNDGWTYRGRGYLQITGRDNYKMVGQVMTDKGMINDPNAFVENPALLEQPLYAALSAGAFWEMNGLNRYATDIETLTKRINGGLIGLDDRKAKYTALLG